MTDNTGGTVTDAAEGVVDVPSTEVVVPDDGSSPVGEWAVEQVEGEVVPQGPPPQMTPDEMQKFADMVLRQVDDDPSIIPNFPLNLDTVEVWALESCMLREGPGVIITFASPSDPRGTPHILSRERALKFASQIKKCANTGPNLAQQAAAAGLSVPPGAGGLILPPGVSAPTPVDDDDADDE